MVGMGGAQHGGLLAALRLAASILAVAACGDRTGLSLSALGASSGSGASSGVTSGASSGSFSAGAASGFSTGSSATGTSVSSSGSGLGPSPCGAGASPAAVSFSNQIMPILQSNCSVGGSGPTALCHGDPSVAMAGEAGGTRQWFGPPAPATSSRATVTLTYDGFVDRLSTEDVFMDLVKPGDPTQSFLWYKINNTQGSLDTETPDPCIRGDLGGCGSAMPLPLIAQTITLLPQANLDLFCNWIVQGALNDLSPCPPGESDESGLCAPCPSGETVCADRCVNEETDPDNCGACAAVCLFPGESCQGGSCACSTGNTLCSGACVSEQDDSNNCGGCGIVCPGLGSCQNGACSCPSGQTGCGNVCVDEQTDPNNCGACGAICPMGAACNFGICAGSPDGCIPVFPAPTNIQWLGTCGAACVPAIGCPASPCLVPAANPVPLPGLDGIPDNQLLPQYAVDGDPTTRYTTGLAAVGGEYFAFDMCQTESINAIHLLTAPTGAADVTDVPAAYTVQVSVDGIEWTQVAASSTSPLNDAIIAFSPIGARYVLLTQTGVSAGGYWWSIHEVSPLCEN